MAKYNTGSYKNAVTLLVECAIQDRQGLIDAYCNLDPEDKERIQIEKDNYEYIEDFERLLKRFIKTKS